MSADAEDAGDARFQEIFRVTPHVRHTASGLSKAEGG